MRVIILAAGFGTRMYPLTKNCAKALLPINFGSIENTTCIDLLINNINSAHHFVTEYYVITNNKFYNDFYAWSKKRDEKITIINNYIDNESEFGPLDNLLLCLNNITFDEDILVCASDNILNFSIYDFIFNSIICHYRDVNILYTIDNTDTILKSACFEIDAFGKINKFAEKPKIAFSNLKALPFYYINKNAINSIYAIIKNISTNRNKLSLGHLIEILLNNEFYIGSYKANGARIDIGSIDDYNNLIKGGNVYD